MNKKPILKDFPEMPTGELFKHTDKEPVKMLTDLADVYGINYELKINKKMTKKKPKVNDLVKRESESSHVETITKFLWLPKTIEGKTKWLVKASWQEQFMEAIDQESLDMGSIICLVWTWKPVKWL